MDNQVAVAIISAVAGLITAFLINGVGWFLLRSQRDKTDADAADVLTGAALRIVTKLEEKVTKLESMVDRLEGELEIQKGALKTMTEYSDVSLQMLLAFVAVVVAPLIEDASFRGLFQTMIRSYLDRPWLAIILTSALFASVHEDFTHWPALFVLALGLGYAYEKSGSLFRPIFMHALFNGAAMAATLAE